MTISKRMSNRKGSMIVEASLVIPIVLAAVFALLYFSLLLYHAAYLQSVADKACERGAVVWTNYAKDMGTGGLRKEELQYDHLYWRVFGIGTEEKQKKVEAYVESKLDDYIYLQSLHKGQGLKRTHVAYENYFFYKKLVVTIDESYKIPIGGLLNIFGINDGFKVQVRSEAVINEPVEFIRNTDFLLDVEKELENKYPTLKNSVDKIREVMANVKDKAHEFFNK
ncbi:MAG: pilus assembly protein [Clostridia bacterium]|nr:pilus assembly protein [Clostridia bacterium]